MRCRSARGRFAGSIAPAFVDGAVVVAAEEEAVGRGRLLAALGPGGEVVGVGVDGGRPQPGNRQPRSRAARARRWAGVKTRTSRPRSRVCRSGRRAAAAPWRRRRGGWRLGVSHTSVPVVPGSVPGGTGHRSSRRGRPRPAGLWWLRTGSGDQPERAATATISARPSARRWSAVRVSSGPVGTRNGASAVDRPRRFRRGGCRRWSACRRASARQTEPPASEVLFGVPCRAVRVEHVARCRPALRRSSTLELGTEPGQHVDTIGTGRGWQQRGRAVDGAQMLIGEVTGGIGCIVCWARGAVGSWPRGRRPVPRAGRRRCGRSGPARRPHRPAIPRAPRSHDWVDAAACST